MTNVSFLLFIWRFRTCQPQQKKGVSLVYERHSGFNSCSNASHPDRSHRKATQRWDVFCSSPIPGKGLWKRCTKLWSPLPNTSEMHSEKWPTYAINAMCCSWKHTHFAQTSQRVRVCAQTPTRKHLSGCFAQQQMQMLLQHLFALTHALYTLSYNDVESL